MADAEPAAAQSQSPRGLYGSPSMRRKARDYTRSSSSSEDEGEGLTDAWSERRQLVSEEAEPPGRAARKEATGQALENWAREPEFMQEPQSGLKPQPEPEPGESPSVDPRLSLSPRDLEQSQRVLAAGAKSYEREGGSSNIRKHSWRIEHGHVKFTDLEGNPREILDFASAGSFEYAKQGKFLRIEGNADLATPFGKLKTPQRRQERVELLLEMLQIFEQEWQMSMPPMILGVTGNAQQFQLRPQYKDIFDMALLKATQATNAWVTTGGTDSGVMRLVGNAMKTGNTPVVGFATWGVIKGRGKLARPSTEKIAARIKAKVCSDGHTLPVGKRRKDMGTDRVVLENCKAGAGARWADPEECPSNIGQRITFLHERGRASSLEKLDLVDPTTARPDIKRRFAEFSTGRVGRGKLGNWGPNQAIDTIVTRRSEQNASTGGDTTQLQVALMYRKEDGVWAIPGKFTTNDEIKALSSLPTGSRVIGQVKAAAKQSAEDVFRLAVRQVFELEGVPNGTAHEYKDVLEEVFKNNAQTLIYRGYSDDPRNTDEAWVETSVWHVHAPWKLAQQLDYGDRGDGVRWMNLTVTDNQVKFCDDNGKSLELFASHREILEMAVLGHVNGTPDMPFLYDGKPSSEQGEIVNLNPNHSHYICVDTGQDGVFGKEVAIRNEVETFISIYDYDLRNLHITELTERFAQTVDLAQVLVDGKRVEPETTSHEIKLEPETTELKVDRIASDGDTRRTYTIRAHRRSTTTQQQSEGPKAAVDKAKRRSRAATLALRTLGHSYPPVSQGADSTVFTEDASDITSIEFSDGVLSRSFDPDVYEYDLVVSPTSEVITVTPHVLSGRKPAVHVTVPTVTMVYGGGPVTLRLLESIHEENAIVVIQGSERAAQFVQDWVEHDKEKNQVEIKDTKRRAQVEAQVENRQKAQAEKSIRSDFAIVNKTSYEDALRRTEKPGWWDVGLYVDALGKLGRHKHLNFFQLDQTFSADTSKEQRNNPLLPTLMTSVFDSKRLKSTVKLPLAIRLNDKISIKKLSTTEGIALKSDPAQDFTIDSRMLVYAAFRDQGYAVSVLLDSGFDPKQLDALIAVELQRALDMPKLVREDQPPSWWVKQQLAAGLDLHRMQSRWNKLPASSGPGYKGKLDIYSSLSWGMMPSLAGWTFQLKSVSPSNDTASDDKASSADEKLKPCKDMILQQLSCRFKDGYWRCNNGALYEREFLVLSPEDLRGKKLKATDDTASETNSGLCREVSHSDVETEGALSFSFETGWRAKAIALWRDNTTAWLPLESECKFHFPVGLEGRQERQLVTTSFFHWLHHDTVKDERQPNDWGPGEWKRDESCPHPDFVMHELHRVYWAIRTNRPKLAEVLMSRCQRPIVAGLFSAYMYRKQHIPRNFVPDSQFKKRHMPKNMRRSCELYACDILDNADFHGSYAAFDEYIFWGTDEDDSKLFREFKSLRKDHRDNANIRAALKLMNLDSVTEPTNIDLALMANSKVFMGQPGVTQFLTKLWRLPSNNGKYTASHLSRISSPRAKCYTSIIGYLVFLGIYVSVILSVPSKSVDMPFTFKEGVFWFWQLASCMSEIGEAIVDFDSFRAYLRGSGNKLDLIVMTMFGTSLIARLWVGSVEDNVAATSVMLGILCVNLILCFIRLLMMLSIVKSIGVMMIITKSIIAKDVFPFLCFAAIVLGAFEFASFYFSWLRDVEHVGGAFFDMFTSLGDFQQLRPMAYELPWWDRELTGWAASSVFFEFVFFVIIIIILMNLLIAMMTDTYSSIALQANATYQMQFAGLVREYYEACVFPVPLSIIERGVDAYIGDAKAPTTPTTGMHWGRHYTWPASQLQFQLDMARKKVQTKQEFAKRAKKQR